MYIVSRIFFVLVVFSPLRNATAHPLFPINEGDVMVYDYAFHIEKEGKEIPSSSVRGKMIATVGKKESKAGREYHVITTRYENIPYSTEPTKVWVREEKAGVYMASELAGKFDETLLLPAEPTTGSEWDYFDGHKSRRKVIAVIEAAAAGQKFSQCLEVVRRVLDSSELTGVINKNVYCPGVGEVHTLFEQSSPMGEYITETTLVERRHGGAQ